MLYYVGDHDGQRRYIPGIKRDDLDDDDVAAAVEVLGAEDAAQAREWLVRSGAWSEEPPLGAEEEPVRSRRSKNDAS